MRIAFVHPRFPSSEGTGATHSATQIVTGLADTVHEICVYCPCLPDELSEFKGCELRHLSGNSNHPHTNTRLNKEIISRSDELREFDIVHSYLTPLIPSIARVGKDSDIGTVITLNSYGGICAKNDLLHRDRENCRSKSTFKCLNCVTQTGLKNDERDYLYDTISQLFSFRLVNAGERRLEHIDGFQALTPHVKETYSEFGFESDKIRVIPNMPDNQFDVEHQTDFGEPFKLLYVGALNQSKGVDRLIDIFSLLGEQSDQDVSLTIVGSGELKTLLERRIKEEELTKLVEIRGQVAYEKLPGIYAGHDVFLYPGRWNEPFGRVFLEAMATGTPIVSTDVGSVNDIIGDAGIITKQSVSCFLDGVLSILDYQTLQRKSTVGKNRIGQYRCSEVIPKFERLYADSFPSSN